MRAIKQIAIALCIVAGVALMGGCSAKQVDPVAVGATLVPGTSNLYRFCDGTTLVYYSNYGSTTNDEYEFIVYGGCSVEGQVITDTATTDQSGVQNLPEEEN